MPTFGRKQLVYYTRLPSLLRSVGASLHIAQSCVAVGSIFESSGVSMPPFMLKTSATMNGCFAHASVVGVSRPSRRTCSAPRAKHAVADRTKSVGDARGCLRERRTSSKAPSAQPHRKPPSTCNLCFTAAGLSRACFPTSRPSDQHAVRPHVST